MIIKQQPETNTNLIRYCGDLITFSVEIGSTQIGNAFLRTNIDRGKVRLKEIIRHAEEELPPLDRDWHDIPMIKKSKTIESFMTLGLKPMVVKQLWAILPKKPMIIGVRNKTN